MATLNKLTYDVREVLKQYSDDSEISDRYIIYLYGIKRAKYLRQDLNNYQRTTDLSITQTLCLELEQVSSNECGIDIQCDTILRTKKPIPQPLELHLKSALTTVKPTKKLSVPFNFITKQKAVYYQYSPFNKGIYAFLDNDNHIYLVSELNTLNLIDCITVTGIFEDPLDLLNYTNCCGCNDFNPCFDIDTVNYPLQPHYVDLIKMEIISELVKTFNIPEDKENNSDDTEK
jgi:hypothetical protein